MTREEVVAATNRVFIEEFEIDKRDLTPQAELFSALGLDSLDTVDLIVALQETFDVNIRNDARIREIETLEDVYQFILGVQQETAAEIG